MPYMFVCRHLANAISVVIFYNSKNRKCTHHQLLHHGLVHGWMTVVEVRRTVGRLNATQNRYRMTPGVRHSGTVN